MSLIENKAHDSLLKKSLYRFRPFLWLAAIAFRSSFVSSADVVSLGRIPVSKKEIESLCRTKKNLPVHIMYVELFTIIIARRQTKNGNT
jgi:hypothetical protein